MWVAAWRCLHRLQFAESMEHKNCTQASIETQWHRSQLESDKRPRLVYVEYLAAAPWNRREIEDPPDFVGTGRALMTLSRRRSADLGYEGRVGLHALPAAEGFYNKLNMPDYGTDPDHDGLVYFEYGRLQR